MAIHFNYIKGLNGDVQELSKDTTSTNSNDVYTYIKWAGRSVGEEFSQDCKFLPQIIVSKENHLNLADGDTQKNLGHIITSNATNQTIKNTIYFNNYVMINNATANKNTIGFVNATNDQTGYEYFSFITKVQNAPCIGCGVHYGGFGLDYHYQDKNTLDKSLFWIAESATFENHAFTVFDGTGNNNYGNNYGSYSDYNAWFKNAIKVDQQVEASYFNATSDRRAKTHIQYWDTSALDIVTQLPIYEFHYKNNDTPSIGVIAQDAAKFDNQFTDFSLVDNPNATGENGDYMTIKESKLVYILWKAVQEQQEQINILQAELNKIKESL